MTLDATLTGVATTAIGVARIRAAESVRPDALFVDPLALELAKLAGTDMASSEPHPMATGLRHQVVLRTACYDRWLLDAIADGVRQVVIVAAGYDARAWRLETPSDLIVWELDQPDVLDRKDRLARSAGLEAKPTRHAISADLREDFASALSQAGHDPAAPTAWLVEGLLIYLDRPAAVRLLETISRLSAARSRLATEAGRDPAKPRDESVKSERLQRLQAMWLGGLGEPVELWLDANGWTSTPISPSQVAAANGRPEPPAETGSGFVTAVRN